MLLKKPEFVVSGARRIFYTAAITKMLHGFQLSLPPAKPFVPMPMAILTTLVQRLRTEEDTYGAKGDREMAAMLATQRAFICTTTYMASRGNETEDITPNGFFRKSDPSAMHHTRDVLARTLDGEFEADGEIMCFRNSNKPLSRKKQLILPHPLRTTPVRTSPCVSVLLSSPSV